MKAPLIPFMMYSKSVIELTYEFIYALLLLRFSSLEFCNGIRIIVII